MSYSSAMLKIRFTDTSISLEKEGWILIQILNSCLQKEIQVITDPSKQVDLELVSNAIKSKTAIRILERGVAEFSAEGMRKYYQKYRLGFRDSYPNTAVSRVWITGENLRAPIRKFDGTLSFDNTDLVTGNVFFPYWFYSVNPWSEYLNYSNDFSYDMFLNSRKPVAKKIAAITFSSNYESRRIQIISAVEKVMPVHKFGKFNKNIVSSKYETSQEFAFQICNENDLYPNYVTEKLVDSWLSRNVPIWSGFDNHGYFNPESIIDVTGLDSNEITDRISKITLDEIMYRQSQPLLLRLPEFDEVGDMFKKVLGGN